MGRRRRARHGLRHLVDALHRHVGFLAADSAGGAGVNTGSLAVTTGVVAFIVLSVTTIFLLVEARRDAVSRKRVARIERTF